MAQQDEDQWKSFLRFHERVILPLQFSALACVLTYGVFLYVTKV